MQPQALAPAERARVRELLNSEPTWREWVAARDDLGTLCDMDGTEVELRAVLVH